MRFVLPHPDAQAGGPRSGKERAGADVLGGMSTPHRTHLRGARRRPLVLAATAAAAVALAACGSSSGGSSPGGQTPSTQGGYGAAPSAAAATTAAAGSATTTLVAHRGALGTFLVDGRGRPVYLFEQDSSTASTCEGACAAAWPPVTVTGTPKAGAGLRQGLLGTTGRTDGTTQVTYAGHPLYRFSADQAPGVPTGQGAKAFGAPWYVVRPSGEKLDAD